MNFLSDVQIRALRAEFGTPLYVYDQARLEQAAQATLAFPNAFGLTARYAMKALPTAAIVRVVCDQGLHIDASSGFEAERALRAGVPADHIQITAQELPKDLKGLVEQGVRFNACSLSQLEAYGRLFPGGVVCVRINPGLGSGHNNRTNVGGPSSSFGIWHERLDDVLALQREYDLKLTRMHTHIGSGSDPEVWKNCVGMSLDIAARLPDVRCLSLGGGFKVGRMPGETSTDLQEIGEAVLPKFREFAEIHGRELEIEVEPGTFMVANAGLILANIIDVVDTLDVDSQRGYRFIKADTGMTEFLRPNLYGAQHPMEVVPAHPDAQRAEADYLVAGHCCESGDLMTPEPGNPEGLLPRRLREPVMGDTLVIGGAGAYCSGLAGKNYNSFPEAAEVLIQSDGSARLIRRRQTLDQILANELID
jgi:diaminopimelate decarboxylase